MQTIEVKPWAESQGASVTINACDFNPDFHQRLDGDDSPIPSKYDGLGRGALEALITASFKAHLARQSDDDLRDMLVGLDRQAEFEAKLASGEIEFTAGTNSDGALTLTVDLGGVADESAAAATGAESVSGAAGADSASGAGDGIAAVEPNGPDTIDAPAGADSVAGAADGDVIVGDGSGVALDPLVELEPHHSRSGTVEPSRVDTDGDGHDDNSGEFVEHPASDDPEKKTMKQLKAEITARKGHFLARANHAELEKILAGLPPLDPAAE